MFMLVLLFSVQSAYSQVTTASINGTVTDQKGEVLPGATVMAVHVPSGTKYGGISRNDGRFYIPAMRVGGPYKVTASYVGYDQQVKENIYLTLGVTTDLKFEMQEGKIEVGEVTIRAQRDAVFSSDRTGASTSINVEALQALPTVTRRLEDFYRLTPQAKGSSFAGMDARMNNIMIDGSYFNNSFGLGNTPGERTGVSPVSVDAVEQVQVNIAPYDVRQGSFVGAAVNTVTKSGTNEFSGTAYYNFRQKNMVGDQAKEKTFDPGNFKFHNFGVQLGGPILKDKLFFFVNYEDDNLTQPGTTFLANPGGAAATGNMTRVLASDLDALSSYLKNKFNYETGPYAGYDNETPSTRFLAKLDFNLDDNNKISLRYTHLDSFTDVLLSNSTSLGNGNRRTNNNALNFQNSNYQIMENIRSTVLEWNSNIGTNMSNNLILGYTYNDESRASRGEMFPFVDILNNGTTYTSFGFEPFTPNNELRYSSYQLQDNFTIYGEDHTLTFGLSAEKYRSENVFYQGAQGVYQYNSLADFYKDADDYLANPTRTKSPVTIKRYQLGYMNVPGMEKPMQPLDVYFYGIYGQDEWRVTKDVKLTLGLRLDMPVFNNENAYTNAEANAMTFFDKDGNQVQYSTNKLPDSKILWSPRVGFNWDVFGDKTTQVRGGSGIFTGKPAYVWISNQVGNNGILLGTVDATNTTAFPFNPNTNAYKPKTVTGSPATSYVLNFTDPDFKFPQLWRNNIAIDQKLPFDLVATAEFLYSRDVNGMYYTNANLTKPLGSFSGVDNRVDWYTKAANGTYSVVSNSNRVNTKVTGAYVLSNQNEGYSYTFTAALEKPYSDNWFAKVAYNYGVSKNMFDPGSIAQGSWTGNFMYSNPNSPALGYSSSYPGNRVIAAASYSLEYFDFGKTTISCFLEGYNPGTVSFTFSGDLNGDGASNDLIYIPKDQSEMNFEQYTSGTTTFTVDQQKAAFDAFINSNDYLSDNRGKYAERNGYLLPMVWRLDLGIAQDIFTNLFEKRNTLQFRVDIVNFTNLLNKDWGVAQIQTTFNPLISRGKDTSGKPLYRMNNAGGVLFTESLQQTVLLSDVYKIQLSFRYIFN